MCSAGLSSYESLATNSGTFQDVYMGDKTKKKKNKKKHRYFKIESPLKKSIH